MPRKATEAKVDPNETPADAFKRLANSRTKKVLKAVDTLSNLSNGRYERTEEQVAAIFGAIRAAVDEAEKSFTAPAVTASADLPDII
jgi:N-glycosylase/DNA lyase